MGRSTVTKPCPISERFCFDAVALAQPISSLAVIAGVSGSREVAPRSGPWHAW